MLSNIINLIAFTGFVISGQSTLLWNIEKPYKYTGFIYTDSQVVVINPAIQIRISNNEEICNFYINKDDDANGRFQPFRAVVKSAHLGLGELELKPNTNLNEWRNKDIQFTLTAEACHNPDSWSVPALVSIRVLAPPGPLWTKGSYNVVIDNNAPIGTTIIKVVAYLPKLTNSDNGICQYLIKSPGKSPFQIDGEGIVRTTEKLSSSDIQYWTLVVAAKDCSQPLQRESQVNVFVSVNLSCKFGWSGFPSLLTYRPGSGVKYISDNPGFQLCNYKAPNDDSYQSLDSTIDNCMSNKTLRLTTSVELKYLSANTAEAVELDDLNRCKFDFQSLRLQREMCGIPSSNALELLTELNRQRTGSLLFPVQANIFPVISTTIDNRFSLYFWMKRDQQIGSTEEYLICQIDEFGDNIFSVSLRKCVLRIQMKSFRGKGRVDDGSQRIPAIWAFTLPQLCNAKWHHVAIVAFRASENLPDGELNIFIDGEIVEFKSGNPEVLLSTPPQYLPTNMTDVFLGHCPKSEKTEFRGLLAGVVMMPGSVLKSSTPLCLTKCPERLYFNGMNQMNPGMSVSLNSEMQMIIINGHSIVEVIRLIKVIGFVNPSWDPKPGQRELTIETEMSCGKQTFSVPPVKINIRIQKDKSNMTDNNTIPTINLISTVTTIIIPDSTQTNSDTGTGVAVFANTTLEMTDIPESIGHNSYEVSGTISKCVVTMHPKLKSREYLDWPRHLLEAVSAEKYSIKVTNTSRTVTFYGLHNEQVYQFVIQHLRYFSSTTDNYLDRVSRTFKLQCFSTTGKSVVKSNVALVKVTIWYNNNQNHRDTTSSRSHNADTTTNYLHLWKDLIDNITIIRDSVPVHAQSNAAIMSESDTFPAKTNNILYNVLLGIGLLTLVSVLIMLIGKYRSYKISDGCVVPYSVVERICFPMQIIREKIRPSPSVRVELSRDFINCISERRRDVSMEMQWDDTELKSNAGFNIIANPMYGTSVDDIDDICVNKDVPPLCEEYESTTDDDTYGDFTDLYLERSKNCDKVKVK